MNTRKMSLAGMGTALLLSVLLTLTGCPELLGVIEDDYTVTYYAGESDSEPPAPQTANSGERIILSGADNMIPPSGKIFDTWKTPGGGSYPANASYTVTNDIDFTAQWITAYTVRFEAGGGSGTPPDSQTAGSGKSITLPGGGGLTTPEEGKVFGGWTQGDDHYTPSQSYTVVGDVVFTARWIDHSSAFTVNFSDGSDVTPFSSLSVLSGESIYLPGASGLTAPSGKTFGGWSSGGRNYEEDDSYTVTRDTTFTVRWIDAYTVSFDINGGSGTPPASQSAGAGETIMLPYQGGMTPPEGKIFGGWLVGGQNYDPGDSYTVTGNIKNIIFAARWIDSGGSGGGSSVPDALKIVIGRGYDITGSYAYSPEIKGTVLDINRLMQDGQVLRDPNLRSGIFESVSGSTITEYRSSLAIKASASAKAGVEGIGSFETEIGANFTMEKARSDQYAFATSTSRITKDAYFINSTATDLTAYITQQFIDDVWNLAPEQVIEKYGTHVMLGGVLGARLDYHMSAKKNAGKDGRDIGAYAKAKAEVTLEGVTGGGGGEASVDTKYSESFETASVETITKAFGGKPELARAVHDTTSYDAWIESIEGNEIWSDYYPGSLIPIYELVGTNRWPEDPEDTLRYALAGKYYEYFVNKKITVNASTGPGYYYGIINLGQGIGTVTKTRSDDEVDSGSGKTTSYDLTVTLSKRGDSQVDAAFVYTVTEGKNNATILTLMHTAVIDLPAGTQLVQLESPTSDHVAGSITRKEHNYFTVRTASAGYNIYGASVRVDGPGNDTNNIGAQIGLCIWYTQRIAQP